MSEMTQQKTTDQRRRTKRRSPKRSKRSAKQKSKQNKPLSSSIAGRSSRKSPSKIDKNLPAPVYALKQLSSIFEQEDDEHVRGVLMDKIFDRLMNSDEETRSRSDWKQQESLIIEALNHMNEDERNTIRNRLLITYIQQRQALKPNTSDVTRSIKMHNHEFPIWIKGTRPLTRVEALLNRWIHMDEYPTVQKLALNFWVSLTGQIGMYEDRIIEQERNSQEAEEDIDEEVNKEGWLRKIYDALETLWYKFVINIASVFSRNHGQTVRNLLREALLLRDNAEDAIEYTLTKWTESSDEQMQQLGKDMRGAINTAMRLSVIGGLIVSLPIILLVGYIVISFISILLPIAGILIALVILNAWFNNDNE